MILTRPDSVHHVGGLQVAVDDPLGVGRREPLRHLEGQVESAGRLEGTPAQEGGERLPPDQLHGDEGEPLRLVDLVDHRDRGVGERGRGLGLLAQPALPLRVVRGTGGQDLEGHLPAQAGIHRAVDRSHAPVADLPDDPVVGQRPSDHALVPTGF